MTEINGTCHNCGLPAGAIRPRHGYSVRINHKAENEFHRNSTRKVWCCSNECAIQALAIAKYGPTTHKWPITLAQFRGTHPLDGLDRTETIAETRINTGAKNGLDENLALEAAERLPYANRAFKRKGGRPRKWNSEADRLREYRRRVHAAE